MLMITKNHDLLVSELPLGHIMNSSRRFDSARTYLCIVRHAFPLFNPKRSPT